MEDETEIRKQILQLEFQHKKDMAEMRQLNRIFFAETNKILDKIARRQNHTQNHLDHITKLAGVTFEELEFQDQKMQDAGEILSRKK